MTDKETTETPITTSTKTSAKSKKLSIKDILALKKPVTKQITVQVDGNLAREIANLQDEITRSRGSERMSNAPEQTPALVKKLADLMDKARETEITFEFAAIGRYAYDELVEDPRYKPTKQDQKEGANFNPLTFPQALVSASCVSPEMTISEAEDLFTDPNWNGAELQRIFYAALECNIETGDTPLSQNGSDATLSSLRSLATRLNAEFPTPSSLGE